MSQTFQCEKCNKSYKKKASLTKHINANKCLVAKKETPEDQTGAIIRLVDMLHDMMRADAIIGTAAYHDINKLLFIRFIQPLLDNRLKSLIDSSIYLSKDEDFNVNFLNILSNLDDLWRDRESFSSRLRIIWKCLSMHPLTENIFEAGRAFNSKPEILYECYKKIVVDLHKVKFDELSQDIKGVLYEHFLNGYAGKSGKEFGQFFTPRNLISLIIKLNNEVFADFNERKIGTIYDPCMGTGGFLTEAYKYIKFKGVEPALYGSELESKTYASGIMNVLLTTGEIHNLKCQNSFYANEAIKYDWILSNPPFGLKQIKRGEIIEKCDTLREKEEMRIQGKTMYPVDINDASALFLTHCMAKLKKNGICNIVLPDGKLTNSGGKYMQLRKLLVEKYNLVAVLSVPGGTFQHAGVSTMVLFFSRETDRTTEGVKFYMAVNECADYKQMSSASYEQIKQNSYSFNYKTYISIVKISSRSNFELKKLGDALIFEKKQGNYLSGDGREEGKYRFYSCAEKIKYIDTCLYSGKDYLIINRGGSANVRIDNEFSCEKNHISICSTSPQFYMRYVYFYLKANLDKINDAMTGITIKGITKENLCNIDIFMPPMDAQQEIANKCEELQKAKITFERSIRGTQDLINIYWHSLNTSIFQNKDKSEKKTLGDALIFEKKQGNYLSGDGREEGKYRFYSCAEKIKYIDTCLYSGKDYLIINRGGSANVRIDNEFSCEKNHISICSTSPQFYMRYVYFYLKANLDKINDAMTGITIKGITKENLCNIDIFMLPLDIQKEISERLDILYDSIQCDKNKMDICDELMFKVLKNTLEIE